MRVLITLERCHLRPWQPSDVRSLVRHANNREVWLNLRDLFPHPYTTADAKRWLAQVCAQEPVTTFAVVVDDSAVGGIGFRIQSDVHRLSAEIGYWLGEGYWGRGIMSEVLAAVTDYAFTSFDLRRLYAVVFEWNPSSAHILEKAGYVFEGRLAQSVIKDGRVIDSLIYARVRDTEPPTEACS